MAPCSLSFGIKYDRKGGLRGGERGELAMECKGNQRGKGVTISKKDKHSQRVAMSSLRHTSFLCPRWLMLSLSSAHGTIPLPSSPYPSFCRAWPIRTNPRPFRPLLTHLSAELGQSERRAVHRPESHTLRSRCATLVELSETLVWLTANQTTTTTITTTKKKTKRKKVAMMDGFCHHDR